MYVDWIRRYILFHQKKHPATMGATEIVAFLSWLAVDRRVSASMQNQALSAVLFLARDEPWGVGREKSVRSVVTWRGRDWLRAVQQTRADICPA